MFAPLMGDDAQEVQRIDVLRVDCQHFPVDRLGFRQAPRLMVLQRGVQLARDPDEGIFARARKARSRALLLCPLSGPEQPSEHKFNDPVPEGAPI